MMGYRVDEIDRRILYRLSQDARGISAPAIADEMEVSPGTIRNRVTQLENEGIIRGYHADIDYEKIGKRITNLFMCSVSVPERQSKAREALEIPGVVNVRELMSGKRNLHVIAVGDDASDLTRIARQLSSLGAEIEDEALIHGNYFSPYRPFGPKGDEEVWEIMDFRSLAGEAETVDLRVREGAAVAGKTLGEAGEQGLLDGLLLLAVERDEEVLTPRGDTELRAGDLVTIFSQTGIADEQLRCFS